MKYKNNIQNNNIINIKLSLNIQYLVNIYLFTIFLMKNVIIDFNY